jgi:hypothetical protein
MDTTPEPEGRGRGGRGRDGWGDLASVAGVLLVGLGALLLVGRLAGGMLWPSGGWLSWENAWPLLPLGAGLGVVLLGLAGGAETGWLVVPGSVVTAVGLILLFDRVTDQWQTWAYTWALVVPTAVGVGLWLQGWRDGRPGLAGRGRRLAALGLALFAGFAALFEVGLNLSGLFAAGLAGYLVPALLIAAGALLLLRRAARRDGHEAGAG